MNLAGSLMKITAIFDAEPVKEDEVREIEKWRRATMFRSGGFAVNEWLLASRPF